MKLFIKNFWRRITGRLVTKRPDSVLEMLDSRMSDEQVKAMYRWFKNSKMNQEYEALIKELNGD